jgi:VCBS repeat-containing protein
VQALLSRIEKVSGDGQTGTASSELANPLVVRVLEGQNPVSGRTVTWIVQGGGGSVSPQNSTTDAQGQASTRWTLGSIGPNTVNAVVSGLGTVTFTATATAGGPSASQSRVTVTPGTVHIGETSTIMVRVRDASGSSVEGIAVSVSASGSGNTISPASATSGDDGLAFFSFRSTVAEAKTIMAVAGGVTLDDRPVITVASAGSTTEITDVDPSPSTSGQTVRVTFTVTGEGGGTPTGDVTVFSDLEAAVCSGPVAQGFCDITLSVVGEHELQATYSGDAQFEESSDEADHVVLPAPSPNTPPTPQPDQYATPGGGQALTVPAPGVLANDSDPDGDALSAQNASDPALGSVSLNSDGGFTYTPDVGASGSDSFTYEASDGSLTSQATVTITINP